MPKLSLQKRIDAAIDKWMGYLNTTNAPLLRTAFLEHLTEAGLTIVEKK